MRPTHRLIFLLLILLSFGRLAWRLDQKNLWFDESLSLQRAESSWSDILRGRLTITDGVESVHTTDQHPFGYFALLGVFTRAAGKSEYALRFPALAAGTLLAPAAWALARRLTRRGALPRSSAAWALLLVAFAPFFLWYGQEARMYTLAPLLAVISTYALLRWSETPEGGRTRLAIGYALSAAAMLTVHYFSVFLLPVQAALVYGSLRRQGRGRALAAAGGLVALGGVIGLAATLIILRQPGAGGNFSPVSIPVLARDLLNAFSLGPGADVNRMLALDLLFGIVAVMGAFWGVSTRGRLAAGGWLLPAWVALPVVLLVIVNSLQPAYMTARHMSLITAAFLILVGGGLAWMGSRWRWLAGVVGVVLLAGMIYASYDYYESPRHGKGDLAGEGEYLSAELLPGDVVILSAPHTLRLYRYYFPLDREGVTWRILPRIHGLDAGTYEELERLRSQYRRLWLVNAAEPIRDWMKQEAFRVREVGFESPIAVLRTELFLPERPILEAMPEGVEELTEVAFGDAIRLRGYETARALPDSQRIPITLYWQAARPIERRYKYVLQVVGSDVSGEPVALPKTEREPYDGVLPTTVWPAAKIVAELTDAAGAPLPAGGDGQTYLALQVYDAETLEKLPVSAGAGAEIGEDGTTLLLPIRAR
jgi:hypothetical protein